MSSRITAASVSRSKALDRMALLEWYRRNRRDPALFDLLDRRGLLQPADRAAASDRVLRGAPAGVQLQHARQEGARRARASTSRSRRLFARGIDPDESPGRTDAGGHAIVAEPRRRPARSPTKPTGRSSTRLDTPTSIVRDIRCSIAPRRCSRSSSTRRCTRRRCCTCGIACRSTQKRAPARLSAASSGSAAAPANGSRSPRAGDARRRSRERAVRLGQRTSGARVRRVRRLRSNVTTSPTNAFWSSSTPAATAIARWWRAEDWQWMQREQHRASAVLGAGRRRVVLARHVRVDPAAARRGPCMSATPKRRRSRAGAARGSRPKQSFSARRSARPMAASVRIRGVTTHRRGVTASSTFRAGIPSRPAAILPARARGASKILSATGGNGRARRSRRFPGFAPMPSYPEYSADFFDGEHFVMKGASPATARELLRPTFRNWFRPRYPYVYATFRCVESTGA